VNLHVTNILKLFFVFQVRVLTPPDDEEKIPDFEDIFNEDEVIILFFLSMYKSNTTYVLYV